jgi:chromate transporter
MVWLGLLSAAASVLGVAELPVLLGAGVIAVARHATTGRGSGGALALVPGWKLPVGAAAGAAVAVPFTNAGLFGVFLKIGSVLYGSGYVLLAFLRTDLVERRHWLTEGQLLDAVAVGQFTPGPVFASATFVGYLLGGVTTALLATAGIFLPAFGLVAASGRLIPRLRAWAPTAALMDGVNASSFALMAVVSARLAMSAVVDLPTGAIGLVAAIVLLRWPVNSAWVVGAGGVAGLLLQWARGG